MTDGYQSETIHLSTLSAVPKSDVKQYEVLQKLAVGGMAEIYLARASGMGGFQKFVVLKRILPAYAKDEQFISMFLDEAKLAAQLQHQNIAQVHDIGQAEGSYFFTMEYLHGEDLRRLLVRLHKEETRLPLACALTIASGAAAGLHYAHDKIGHAGKPLNIVHRDVSLSNIVVTYDGGIKLVDFGVARASAHDTETRTGSLKGKISYMSPEQCEGKKIDRRSDIFSLGIVLYELTTGMRLFGGRQDQSDYAVMNQIVEGRFDAPCIVSPNYPPELELIVLKALASRPEDRYQTARELLTDIEMFAANARLPLSTSALAGFIEGVYGHIPEPWHAIENSETVRFEEPVKQTISALLPDEVSSSIARYGEDNEGPTIIAPQSWNANTRAVSQAEAAAMAAQPPPRKTTMMPDAAYQPSQTAEVREVREVHLQPTAGNPRRWVSAVAALAVLIVGGGVAWTILAGSDDDSKAIEVAPSNQAEVQGGTEDSDTAAKTTPDLPQENPKEVPDQTPDDGSQESAGSGTEPPVERPADVAKTETDDKATTNPNTVEPTTPEKDTKLTESPEKTPDTSAKSAATKRAQARRLAQQRAAKRRALAAQKAAAAKANKGTKPKKPKDLADKARENIDRDW